MPTTIGSSLESPPPEPPPPQAERASALAPMMAPILILLAVFIDVLSLVCAVVTSYVSACESAYVEYAYADGCGKGHVQIKGEPDGEGPVSHPAHRRRRARRGLPRD